jgi:TetR/AcrR family transcriptional regulator, transcriptional repressor for nem operon
MLQAQLKAVFGLWQKGIAEVLREAVKRSELARSTDPDRLAEFLLNSYEGALVRMKAEKSDGPLDTFLHFAFDVLLKK